MYQIEKGIQKDFEDIRDFANFVFSQSDRPHDFRTLLPKIYDDKKDTAGYHYLIREDSKIKAMVCVWPVTCQFLDISLKAASIGTVSVHPYSRDKGYMKLLMTEVIKDMKSQGYAFSFLGGQRQRYEYFGYEPSGIQLIYTITKANIRHFDKVIKAEDISLLPFEQKEGYTDLAYELYRKQKVKAIRSREEFITILRSWASKPYLVFDQGDFAGYVSIQANGMINELLLEDDSRIEDLLKSLLELTKLEKLCVIAAPYETEKNQRLSAVSEDCAVQVNHNYCILQWKEVISALLALKAEYSILADGTLTIGIDKLTLEITVKNHSITIREVNGKADINLTSLTAEAILMSPAGIHLGYEYIKSLDQQKQLLFATWFPLPLFTAAADGC